MATWTADARPLLDIDAGAEPARAEALVLDEPLSFWGGVDAGSGAIIDRHHPQRGQNVRGRALVMPSGRGSSSSSSVLAEAIRAGHGPAMVILAEVDEILALGALVAQLLDGTTVPVLVLEREAYSRIATGDLVAAASGGRIRVTQTRR